MSQAIRWVFRRDRARLAVGLVGAAALFALGPADVSNRLLLTSALMPLAGWIVLGRDARRRADGARDALQIAPRAGRLVALEWLPGMLVVAALALAGARSLAAVPLFVWGAVCLLAADVADRRASRPGVAWAAVWIPAIAVLTAPVWLGPFYGRTALAPELATWTIGAHPAAMALDASGRTALQDPNFYTWTLSGVLEVRPLSWLRAVPIHVGVAAALALAAVGVARRPVPN